MTYFMTQDGLDNCINRIRVIEVEAVKPSGRTSKAAPRPWMIDKDCDLRTVDGELTALVLGWGYKPDHPDTYRQEDTAQLIHDAVNAWDDPKALAERIKTLACKCENNGEHCEVCACLREAGLL